MKIETVSYNEARTRVKALGKTFTPGSEGEFAAFEEKYLGAYDLIFEAIGKVAALDEYGKSEGGDLNMSEWMTPQRLIGVVVENDAALQPTLVPAICRILNQLDEEYEDAKFAVQLQSDSATVYVFPGDHVLIKNDSAESDLTALGLR